MTAVDAVILLTLGLIIAACVFIITAYAYDEITYHRRRRRIRRRHRKKRHK